MAEKKQKDSPSGREAVIAAFRATGRAATASEIAALVIESGVVSTLKGKTPKATLSAQITSGAKKGETFKKVGSGRPQKFELRADVGDSQAALVDKLREHLKAAAKSKVTVEPRAVAQASDLSSSVARPDPKPAVKHAPRGTARRKQPVAA